MKKILMLRFPPGGYSGLQVLGMIKGFFLGLKFSIPWFFSGMKIRLEYFLGVAWFECDYLGVLERTGRALAV